MSNSAASRTVSKPTKGSSSRTLRPPKRNWRKPKTWFYRQIVRKGTLPKARQMMLDSFALIWRGKKQVFGLYVVYCAVSLVFAKGVANATDLANIKTLLSDALSGIGGSIQTTSLQLTYLFSGSGSETASANAGVYQAITLLLCSLALIWLLRQLHANKPVTVKQSFYSGMYPLVPLIIVLVIIGFQLIPFAIGSYVYTTLLSGGIAVGFVEQAIALLVFIVLAAWSFRMVAASVFAIFIVTLPNVAPRQAIRSAKQLVAERRLLVLRKILPMPILLVIVTSIIVAPCIIVSPGLAVWVFFAVSSAWFICVITYLYVLYKELLDHE